MIEEGIGYGIALSLLDFIVFIVLVNDNSRFTELELRQEKEDGSKESTEERGGIN
jgi:hypothetical protein